MYEKEICNASEIWEYELMKYFSELFEDHWFPSHNIEHHIRVWKNACFLAPYFKPECEDFVLDSFFEQLLIACYFHDLGLLREKGPRHGRESRLICESFLSLHVDKIRFETTDMLEAIEHHDDKDYNTLGDTSHSILYQVLTLADDLDAFGAVGCYRYIEIYLIRRLKPNEIPALILENAENRYRNFVSKMQGSGFPLPLIEDKNVLLKKLLSKDSFVSAPKSLVEWIDNSVVQPRIDPFDFFKAVLPSEIQNERIRCYIDQICLELK